MEFSAWNNDESIRPISAAETYEVRHPVLRAGKPLESCRFDGDDLLTTRHLGFFMQGKLAAVASLFAASHNDFNVDAQIQLRGMAVLEMYRGQHIGAKLLKYAEEAARAQGATLIWFNARLSAKSFYEKSGYVIYGDVFDIGDIGPHFVMRKML